MKDEQTKDGFDDTPQRELVIRSPKMGNSPGNKKRPIPDPHNGIQVNFCRNPGCSNFGIPPDPHQKTGGRGNTAQGADGYKINGDGQGTSSLLCHHCGKSSRMKSNKAVYEEYRRQGGILFSFAPVRCRDQSCENHEPGNEISARFQRFGATSTGAPRFRCRKCGKTCSVPSATSRQRRTSVNAMVFRMLVNKVAVSRMLEMTGLSVGGLYRKIDFIHRQCLLFAAAREAKLRGMEFRTLHLNTDRQDYIVNWRTRRARRTVQLTGIATADRYSRYVFGMDINFDPTLDADLINERAEKSRDADRQAHLREYARVWTEADLEESTKRAAAAAKRRGAVKEEDGEEPLDLTTAREDLEAPEALSSDGQQLPNYGMQVHAEFLMHGHYHLLADLLRGAKKLNFTIDGDSGMLAACMGAFASRIADHSADVVQTLIAKDLTVDDRKKLYRAARKWFLAARLAFPGLDDFDAKVAILAKIIEDIRISKLSDPESPGSNALQDRFIANPFPDLAEPEKKWLLITDMDHLSHEKAARLLLRSTLYPVDTVFNQVRKRVSMAERPVISVRRARRLWHMYSAYDPAMLAKVLQIFRVWHNFLGRSAKDDKTPAERLGLVAGEIRLDHILGFNARDLVKRHMRDEVYRAAAVDSIAAE